MIVSGYLRNCNHNYDVDIPVDMYNIILKYYYQSNDDEWIFVKNDQIPLACNCTCVLVNDERDIMIIGNADSYGIEMIHFAKFTSIILIKTN